VKILKKWDFRHNFESRGAPVMEAWEFMIATYMHETTIEEVRLRRGLYSYPAGE
jgi:hypothetical protein